ncbi:unnamed protein product [Caenorhabditis sp. 36 PRJEB53466]|nr:unnamed protein product [Caenorhabditis sp. 36 PRJEB53466]
MLSPTPLFAMRPAVMNVAQDGIFYSTSPYSSTSSSDTRESMMNTPVPYADDLNHGSGQYWAAEHDDQMMMMASQTNCWQDSPSAEFQYHQTQAVQPLPPTRLPAISNLMKDSQLTAKPVAYYSEGSPTMNDYRVEKVANTLIDPYVHIDQPTYADFTNAQVLNHQQEMLQMNFPTQLSTSYMNTAQVPQPPMPFNIFELNLTNFTTFNSACDTPLPLLNSSPTHQYTPMPNFTPPPQDPLAAEPKQIKKRMAAVQCHQNSICSNCKTRETTLWRRNGEGGVECNACNLYFRKNNRKRPLSLRKDGIMKRNRRPRNESPNSAHIRHQQVRHGHATAC